MVLLPDGGVQASHRQPHQPRGQAADQGNTAMFRDCKNLEGFTTVVRIRIRRIQMFFGLPDPDPFVRDTDPDPYIIKQK